MRPETAEGAGQGLTSALRTVLALRLLALTALPDATAAVQDEATAAGPTIVLDDVYRFLGEFGFCVLRSCVGLGFVYKRKVVFDG